MGIKQPTHVLLQAGVGALAGGVLGYLVDCFGAKNLHSIVVEPDQADCIYRSGVAGRWSTWGRHAHHHGRPRLRRTQSPRLAGAARLHHPVHLLSRQGLGARHARARQPLGDDPRIISGESGSVGTGVLAAVRHHPDRAALMARLGLDEQSVVLVINTEGDTDVAHYREVVWEGKHPPATNPCENRDTN